MVASTALVVAPRSRSRDRWMVLVGLGVVTVAAWTYLVVDRHSMSAGMARTSMANGMSSMAHLRSWTASELGLRLLMWVVMMVAMMVPTAAPMTLMYAAVARKARAGGYVAGPTFAFVAGYVFVWTMFSVVATFAQLGLDRLALLSSSMVLTSPWIGGAVLAAAGVYELTPLKQACLANCRAPAHFIARRWQAGTAGALRMGMRLGVYCLGCCWILMALLFVGGVMNLLWIAAIAVFVLAEKTMPFADAGSRVAAAALMLTGLATATGLAAFG